MEEDKKLQILDEIKRIERELYLKRSQLASVDAMAYEAGVYEGSDPEERKKVFSQLIKEIERLSTGGNSVEEIERERQR
jgi:hypothetical protein